MRALLCPGQGSQRPGGFTPWTTTAETRSHAATLSDWAGIDLLRHGTESGAETIRDTAVAQPLIVSLGLMAWAEMRRRTPPSISGSLLVAGHSVGEITAAVIAGVLTEREGMQLAALRGRAMAEAARSEPTGMAAVIGGDPHSLAELLPPLGLAVANHNGEGQVVVAGPAARLADLRAAAPVGARVIPLKVAGAFHTHHMLAAAPQVAALIATFSPRDPQVPLVSNRDGRVLTSATEVTSALVTQITSPVRWDRTMHTMAGLGMTEAVELPPAGTLQGLLSRAYPEVDSVRFSSPEEIPFAGKPSVSS